MVQKEQLGFERLLSEISTRFVNISTDHVDEEIDRSLKKILEFFQVDRCGLVQIVDRSSFVVTHLAVAEGVAAIPFPGKHCVSIRSWAFDRLIRKREVVSFTSLDDLPDEALADKQAYVDWGVRSTLNIPIIIDGPVDHIFALNSVTCERDWPEELISRLKIFGEILVNALMQRNTHRALRESEERLRLAIESVGMGLWTLYPDTGKVWVSEKTREVFRIAMDEKLNHDSIIEKIHPDDRDWTKEVFQQALLSGDKMQTDFRIITPDGIIQWICSSGQLFPHGNGEPNRFICVSFDITARKLMEEALERRHQFEKLLIEISTRFVNQSVDGVDREIEDALHRICEFLDIDLAAVWQWLPEPVTGLATLTHSYCSEGTMRLPVGTIANEYFPWYEQQIKAGRTVKISSFEELPAEAAIDREMCRDLGIKSNVTIPLSVGGELPIGAIGINSVREERTWSEEIVRQIELVAQIFANAIERKRMEHHRLERLLEIEALGMRLEHENLYLQEEISRAQGFEKIVGSSDALNYVLFRIEQVAPTDASVLILGETGTGKGLVANAIHAKSARKNQPMLTVNCAALPPNLIESELFGREKGAFTGANIRLAGRFEVANRGTIFLDEIGELPLELQSKLLRVLQDGEFERLGSANTIKVDVRVIASTSRDLKVEVRNSRFREDLFYRLNVFPVSLPTLRTRVEDIPMLAHFFVDKFSKKYNRQIKTIPKSIIKMLQNYAWPGNVRELEHVIERSVIISSGPVLQMMDLFQPIQVNDKADSPLKDLAEIDREHIQRALREVGWKIEGAKGAAAILKIHPSTLRFRIKKLNITRPL